ncbi:MAG TPA: hemerythrin domain-containing protein [Candidatus Polarisedimenticolia bacterium]|nr:hemerythrin domain-containing protein [Candidatus Polarisedimenticolia bacterium]
MTTRLLPRAIIGLSAIAVMMSSPVPARTGASQTSAAELRIPGSIKAEHEAIHAALIAAMQTPGRVGIAAKALAEVLHPHFVREEQIALPPLGLLASLASGEVPSDSQATPALEMSDALRHELPRMLEEHVRIRAAVEALRVAALADLAPAHERLAEDLALHARTEEDVLYPAAILVGDLIRIRRQAGAAR